MFKHLTLTACLLSLTSFAASADTLRFSHIMPPDHYFDKDAKAWADALTAASDGEIEVQVFPASQLGGPVDQFDMARDGIADVAWVNWGYTPGAFPIMELIDIPFSITAPRDAAARGVHNWYKAYAETEMPDVHFCLAHVGPPGTFHSSKPIATPADIQGLKVRPSGGTMAQVIADMGGSAIQVPGPEVRSAIDRGVADAITFPWGSLKVFGISEAVKYHLDRNMYFAGAGLVMNKAKYEGLSEAGKAAVDTVCSPEWAEKLGASWVEFEAGGKDLVMADEGHQLHVLTDAEMDEWRSAASKAGDRWIENVTAKGHDAAAILDALTASIAAETK
ncbi:TRAP transporter substrate-binding protein [Mesobacterium pallidum]|uniref:TRAP transporter substrate-binding protein n=1 Tax=Mesobacterium pallidum TaxID=2872037 RepID=UPI001EE345B1|nr:TRAP transporter substrate-binding protein [Mesobacterium pallidum]